MPSPWRWPLLLVLPLPLPLLAAEALAAEALPPNQRAAPSEIPAQVAVADVRAADVAVSTAPSLAGHVQPPQLAYPLARPAEGMDPWGWRYSSRRSAWRMHTGVDLAADQGTPVLASLAGRVVLAESIEGYGATVLLDHGGGWQTLYAHLLDTAVQAGQWLEQGATLGSVGMTGSATGPHLHFELRRQGASLQALDPTPHLPPLMPPPSLPPALATIKR